MTEKTLDAETRIKLLEIAAQITVASVGGATSGVEPNLGELFEKHYQTVLNLYKKEHDCVETTHN